MENKFIGNLNKYQETNAKRNKITQVFK